MVEKSLNKLSERGGALSHRSTDVRSFKSTLTSKRGSFKGSLRPSIHSFRESKVGKTLDGDNLQPQLHTKLKSIDNILEVLNNVQDMNEDSYNDVLKLLLTDSVF